MQLQDQLDAKKEELRAGRGHVDEADLELEANNRLYEEYLSKSSSFYVYGKYLYMSLRCKILTKIKMSPAMSISIR